MAVQSFHSTKCKHISVQSHDEIIIPFFTLLSLRPASLASVCVLTGVVRRWLRVHSSWPRLSYTDSSSRRVSVFVCSVLCHWSQRADGGLAWRRHFLRTRLRLHANVGCNSCESEQVKPILCLCVSSSQYGTAKAQARSLPPPPSATTAVTPCPPASRCSSRCLRADLTTATVYCHLMPRWWVKTPGPSRPQIR